MTLAETDGCDGKALAGTKTKMEHNREAEEGMRLLLIGGRWGGKSSSGNTILRNEKFEFGRTRTFQSEVRHGTVQGRKLTVVDSPGWNSFLSLSEIPERDKQTFKLNVAKCPPGPCAFLLVIPIDIAFSVEQKRTLAEHMKLLGERAWRYSLVLFTCGDYLQGRSIEEHIEREGDPLKWLVERCGNRYHVFDNKDKNNAAQVTLLLEKIDELIRQNQGGHYELDEQMLHTIQVKQQEVAQRAKERRTRAEEQFRIIQPAREDVKPIQTLQMILLGSRGAGKTSLRNTILGIKEEEVGKRTVHSVGRRSFVGQTEITLVDTPGWWKGFTEHDTPEAIKEEVKRSVFLCPPGPHVFVLVIDADASFSAKNSDAVKTHMELLGEDVWRRTIVVFTRGDWLGTAHTIEEFIEGEGEALQSLVEQCGNRYHIIDNKNSDRGTQVAELMEKITWTVAENDWEHFVPDEQIYLDIEEKRRRVEERARQRQHRVSTFRKSFRGSRNTLTELRILLLGQKTVGKSATGNSILQKKVFATCQNEQCQEEKAVVADRLVQVIDTPGWWKESSRCNREMDKEIVRGLDFCPSGVHVVLLVVPLELTFREAHRAALEEHLNLFDASVWKHTMVLFTYVDRLVGRSIEEHIEREHDALHWLVDKCENKYHGLSNIKKDMGQITELIEKIEETVAGNDGRLFCPDTRDVQRRLDEKFREKELKTLLKQCVDRAYRQRELQLLTGLKNRLLELHADISGSSTSTRPKLKIGEMPKPKVKGIGQRRKDGKEKKESIEAKLLQETEKLDKDILRATDLLRGSMDFLLPTLSGDTPYTTIVSNTSLLDEQTSKSNHEKIMRWLSKLQVGTDDEDPLTINFSETSGYRSVLPQGDVPE